MIFVTVGTHEQQFNRLIRYMDELKQSESFTDEVIIQTGYSTYEPKSCKWNRLFSYKEMIHNIEMARIIITHGGPSSFMMALQIGKIPIVVPRKKEFKEHVNNHQMEFVEAVSKKQKNIIPVYEIDKLGKVINDYETIIKGVSNEIEMNNLRFNEEINKIVIDIFK